LQTLDVGAFTAEKGMEKGLAGGEEEMMGFFFSLVSR